MCQLMCAWNNCELVGGPAVVEGLLLGRMLVGHVRAEFSRV